MKVGVIVVDSVLWAMELPERESGVVRGDGGGGHAGRKGVRVPGIGMAGAAREELGYR